MTYYQDKSDSKQGQISKQVSFQQTNKDSENSSKDTNQSSRTNTTTDQYFSNTLQGYKDLYQSYNETYELYLNKASENESRYDQNLETYNEVNKRPDTINDIDIIQEIALYNNKFLPLRMKMNKNIDLGRITGMSLKSHFLGASNILKECDSDSKFEEYKEIIDIEFKYIDEEINKLKSINENFHTINFEMIKIYAEFEEEVKIKVGNPNNKNVRFPINNKNTLPNKNESNDPNTSNSTETDNKHNDLNQQIKTLKSENKNLKSENNRMNKEIKDKNLDMKVMKEEEDTYKTKINLLEKNIDKKITERGFLDVISYAFNHFIQFLINFLLSIFYPIFWIYKKFIA